MSTAPCCPKGSWPALVAGPYDTAGEVVDLPEFEGTAVTAYVTGDRSSSRRLILIPDIWDFEGGRSRAVADQLASMGYLVVHPRFFHGLGSVPDLSDVPKFLGWIKQLDWAGRVRPIVASALNFAKVDGATIFFAGFCWGCWVALHASADPLIGPSIRATVDFHPSIQLERWAWGGDEQALADKAVSPHLFLTAGNDQENVKPGGELVKSLQARPETAASDAAEYPDMAHGWVPRGDVADEKVARDVRAAIVRAAEWLAQF